MLALCCQKFDIYLACRKPGLGFRTSVWMEMSADMFALYDQTEEERVLGKVETEEMGWITYR